MGVYHDVVWDTTQSALPVLLEHLAVIREDGEDGEAIVPCESRAPSSVRPYRQALTNGHPPSFNGRHASAGEIVVNLSQKSYFDFDAATGFTCHRYI